MLGPQPTDPHAIGFRRRPRLNDLQSCPGLHHFPPALATVPGPQLPIVNISGILKGNTE